MRVFSGWHYGFLVAAIWVQSCGFADESPDADNIPVPGEYVDQKADSVHGERCERERLSCEQTCFREFGQTWGTLSLSYRVCLRQCRDFYEDCRQKAVTIPADPAVCDTDTVSWDQPDSDGVCGYWGYCGPTAASNIVSMVCGGSICPRDLADTCFSWAPGTTPANLARALSEVPGCGTWEACAYDLDHPDPLSELERSLPVPVLLDWKGNTVMHWVTVVGVQRQTGVCRVTFNHWGRQDKMLCDEFLQRWSLTATAGGAATVATRTLIPFTFVCQTETESAPRTCDE
jgi:hypothetical protein